MRQADISLGDMVRRQFDEREIKGYSSVVNGREGELVTVSGYVDVKGMCHDVTETERSVCTVGFLEADTDSMLIRLNVCSETRRSNCIVWPNYVPVDFRDVFAYDNEGRTVDVDGRILIEPPNTWMNEAEKVKITGMVSVINGKGKFVTPIERIERY